MVNTGIRNRVKIKQIDLAHSGDRRIAKPLSVRLHIAPFSSFFARFTDSSFFKMRMVYPCDSSRQANTDN